MTRVLLTGGSGYIAANILEVLLQRGHSVVATVRTQAKANKIKEKYPSYGKDKLDVVLVPDMAQEGAFDQAVVSEPPFEAVIHPTSPFHFKVTDIQKQLLDPAILGATGILKSIKQYAPSVNQVVLTSSLAAMIHPWAGEWPGNWPGHVYSEDDWNPITKEQAYDNPLTGYRASKKQAEQAAWDFVSKENPNFALTTICPPLVLGPIAHHVDSLDKVNESLQRIRTMITGRAKDEIPPNGAAFIFVDVRDAALYHVLSIEKPEAAGKRFFIPTGYFSNKEISQIIAKNYPEIKDLPSDSTPGGGYPTDGLYTYDNQRTQAVFDDIKQFRGLEECIVDTVKSLQAVGA